MANKTLKIVKQITFLITLLKVLSFCPNAMGRETLEMSLEFSNTHQHLVPIKLNPGEFALATLHTKGSETIIELLDSTDSIKKRSYEEVELLQQQLAFFDTECLECTLRISSSIPPNTHSGLRLNIEIFSSELSERRSIEQTLDNHYKPDYPHNFQETIFAINAMSESIDNQLKMRSCYHSLSLDNSKDLESKINSLLECRQITKSEENWAAFYKLSIQLVRFNFWHNDNPDIATTQLVSISNEIKDHLNKDEIECSYLLGRVQLLLGTIYTRQGLYLDAHTELKAAESYFDKINAHYNLSEAIAEQGFAFLSQNHLAQAKERFKIAFEKSLMGLDQDPFQQLRLRYQLSRINLYSGDFHDALRLVENIGIETPELTPIWKGHYYALKARINLELRRFDIALDLYNKAWTTYEQLGAETHLPTLARNLAQLYTETGDYEGAEKYLNLANKILNTSWNSEHEATLIQAKINFHLKKGETDLALKEFENIERILVNSENTSLLGRVLSLKGETLFLTEEPELAKRALTSSIGLLEKSDDQLGLIKSHYLLAKLIHEYNASHSDAFTHLRESLSIIEQIRAQLLDDQIRRDFFGLQKSVYELSIAALHTPKNPDIASLIAAEQFKSRTLYEAMSDDNRYKNINAPESRKDELTASFDDLSHKTTLDIAYLIPSERTLEQYQAQLESDEAMLYYFVGENGSYLWLIDSSSVHSYPLPPKAEIRSAAKELLTQLNKNPAYKPNRSIWKDLLRSTANMSTLLLGPTVEKLGKYSKLTIVPDDVLHQIPFGVLQANFKQPLIVEKTITYASSISTQGWLNASSNRNRESRDLLILANPTYSIRQNSTPGSLVELPFTRTEAQEIIDHWEQVGHTDLLEGKNATKRELLSLNLQEYSVLHFASHAVVDWDHPTNTFISLSSDHEHDIFGEDNLSILEISQMDIGSDLVILSACETVSGKHVIGEGPLSLSRAFFEAGATRVIASLWPVDDKATEELITAFYNSLIIDATTPGEALTEAKKLLMKSGEYSHPYFWSGFIMTGTDQHWTLVPSSTHLSVAH